LFMPAPVHIAIAEPCHENWQAMAPNEQGRHCMSCQKTVIDFSLMSDQEILHYISTANRSICGRFDNDQLNKTYEEKKVPKPSPWRYAWNMVVATFLLTGNAAMAQSKPSSIKQKEADKKKNNVPDDLSNTMLGGLVIRTVPDEKAKGVIVDDSTGIPVSYASIRIKGLTSVVTAREDGNFSFNAPVHKNKVTVFISAEGYETTEYELPLNKPAKLKILLPANTHPLKPVKASTIQPVSCNTVKGEVTATPLDNPSIFQPDLSLISGVVGGVSVTRRHTVAQKIKREVKNWLPKTSNELRVYPNPIIAGNSITINLKLEKAGDYKLELMDADGRIVWIQAIQDIQQTQTISVPTQAAWSKGVYWLRVTGATKKAYTAKVLLQ
jgi:hypothetical protein